MNVGFLVLLATVATVKGQLELLPVLTMDWAVQWMDVVDIFNTTGHGVIDNISDPTIISWFVPFTTTTTLPSSNSTFLSTLSSTSTVAEAESTLAANSTEASTWAYTPTPAGTQGTSENFLETEAASTSLAPEKLSQTSPELTQTSEPFSQSESTQISLSTNETAAAPETTAAATQEPSSATSTPAASTPAASTSPSESSTVWMIESESSTMVTPETTTSAPSEAPTKSSEAHTKASEAPTAVSEESTAAPTPVSEESTTASETISPVTAVNGINNTTIKDRETYDWMITAIVFIVLFAALLLMFLLWRRNGRVARQQSLVLTNVHAVQAVRTTGDDDEIPSYHVHTLQRRPLPSPSTVSGGVSGV